MTQIKQRENNILNGILKLEAQEQIEQNAPIKIFQTASWTKIKIKNIKTFKNMMNNTKIRTTQKLKEEKAHLTLKEPWLMIPYMMDCAFMIELICWIFGGFAEASMDEMKKDGSYRAMDSLKVHDR